MLGDYEGYVQTDGYEVCDRACDGAKNVVHVGCFAHARRMFHDAHKNSKKAGSAEGDLATIARLYRVENQRELYKDPQDFAAERRRQVEPILAEFRTWRERRAAQVPPETLLGKAIRYTLGQWPKLIRYTDHPAIGSDTNAVENSIRPFVVGRAIGCFRAAHEVLPPARCCSASFRRLARTARNPTGFCAGSSRNSQRPARILTSSAYPRSAPSIPDPALFHDEPLSRLSLLDSAHID